MNSQLCRIENQAKNRHVEGFPSSPDIININSYTRLQSVTHVQPHLAGGRRCRKSCSNTKRFKRTLIYLNTDPRLQIFWEIPFMKPQNDT